MLEFSVGAPILGTTRMVNALVSALLIGKYFSGGYLGGSRGDVCIAAPFTYLFTAALTQTHIGYGLEIGHDFVMASVKPETRESMLPWGSSQNCEVNVSHVLCGNFLAQRLVWS